MKRSDRYLCFLALMLFTGAICTTAEAQDARLNLNGLTGLESRAQDVVEVNIDGKLLDLAKRVTQKVNDEDAKTVAKAIAGLKGIYVRVYRFERDNEYNSADVDAIRAQLNSPGWEKVANIRSRKNDQKVDVFTMFSGDIMSGVAVVISETKSIAVVNMIGPIDIELLTSLGGKLNIPKIEIENGSIKNPKPIKE